MKYDFKRLKKSAVISSMIASLLSVSCSQDQGTQNPSLGGGGSSSGSGGGTSSSPDNASGFYAKAVYSAAYPYTTHKGTGAGTDDWTSECAVQSTDVTKDITCIVEARELDLWYNGVEIEYNVPASMCEYMVYQAPYYYNYEPGVGPTRVVVNDDTAAHEGVGAGLIGVGSLGALTTQTSIYCDQDYSNIANPAAPVTGDGPNCCSGKYNLITYASGGAATSSIVEWGGKPGNCLKGPALFVNPMTSSGYPASTIIRTGSSGTKDTYQVKAPENFFLSNNYFSSNYFNTADHGGLTPLAYRSIVGVAPATNPYHLFLCYDRAHEVSARIRLMVREWNTIVQFDMGAAGDADVAGAEAGFGNEDENDYGDFKDLGNAYPEEIYSTVTAPTN